ncbi:class A beta-lactamase-related serine hydrolase [Tetragenococcus koreensis]|uniref:serine hydrolase n=1 Tax=Tetragenococcus koreensis TaxID=290335 RepID=UPI001F216901|nr:serine hydrolase [Tetragenococcus koreensis]MCF1584593.1 class A beta-lactamase-related serine hydrolase [Tetragenococcus koreensis]MCF1614145.1 class A beta-lactamase-related serine hydrolase [Tetragenococcus koreensis]MCF1619681.1 class A beta-lactamase-related serine hydrolase [Tetragenococcus koreensis]MCF1623974.1 class A beta-lactamase-related serine hydrolase [Tetragenococcus koreensis]MCF1641728.1 class A beta-lactamase-related serine hydrolase [Tetragenococcus koreensis]
MTLGFWFGDSATTEQEETVETESTTSQIVATEEPKENEEELENKLQQKGDQWAKEHPNSLEFRVYDLDTEQTYTYTNDEKDKKYKTASIVKVAVAMLLLHEKEEDQEELTDEEEDLLSEMILSSDNEAASSLLDDSLGGYESLQTLFDELDMGGTKVDADNWGNTTTTTKDQMKLLQELYLSSQYLTEESQDYIIDLMSHIDREQSWGVYEGSSNVSLKNGWLDDEMNGINEEWIVSSIGKVTRGDNSYLAVALSDKNPTIEEGSQIIEDLVRISSDYLL